MAAVDALELERFHLVVHDIGGPVGFELAATIPARVASLTVLNSLIAADGFKKPWPMRPFGVRGLGRLWLMSLGKALFRRLMKMKGIADMTAVSKDELGAWVDLLKRDDGGRAFLAIMRSFETSAEKEARYLDVMRGPYPVQIVWGERDDALTIAAHAEPARRAAGIDDIIRLPAKHFLQEDQAPEVARLVAQLVARANA